jgi:hypothetical protein
VRSSTVCWIGTCPRPSAGPRARPDAGRKRPHRTGHDRSLVGIG